MTPAYLICPIPGDPILLHAGEHDHDFTRFNLLPSYTRLGSCECCERVIWRLPVPKVELSSGWRPQTAVDLLLGLRRRAKRWVRDSEVTCVCRVCFEAITAGSRGTA